jgi:hypothetical protein
MAFRVSIDPGGTFADGILFDDRLITVREEYYWM